MPIMSSFTGGPADSPFMDDFYAECDDHLGQIRRTVLKLEESANAPDAAALDELFRSFHSLKGICGMAGIEPAERLAHRTEDYLRSLTKHEADLTNKGIDVLNAVTAALEQIVVSFRQSQPLPEIASLLERVGQAMSRTQAESQTASSEQQLQDKVADARARGLLVWKCTFVPSSALEERGINVSAIRARLQAAGQILQSTPKVRPGGAIEFQFILATAGGDSPFTGAEGDGLVVKPWESTSVQTADKARAERPNAPAPQAFITPSHIVRVDLTRLDELMRIMGELVIHRARFDDTLNKVGSRLPTAEARALQEVNQSFGRELRILRDALMRVRLVPIAEIFERLPFVARDLARDSGKKIRLQLEGRKTEIDKYLVERLKDPLLHLVRNAICHGIESPEERLAQGKAAEGRVSLRASTSGEQVIIEISDDGGGIDAAQIGRAARAAGLPAPENPSPDLLLDLICAPGFSTRDEADRAAGRGVGMAAVKASVLELGGEMYLSTVKGEGTTFTLRLPLTLAIADALIISAGNQKFAIPQAVVQEITTTTTSAVSHLEQNEVIVYRNGTLPLLRLTSIFGLKEEVRQERPVLVVGTGLNAVGIVADRVLGQREIVIRSINDPLLKIPAISGATELGDGRAILIIDSMALIQTGLQQKRAFARARGQSGVAAANG